MKCEQVVDELAQWLRFMVFDLVVRMDKEANRPSGPERHVELMAQKEAYEAVLDKLTQLQTRS
jgi:hypothetical protein